MDVLVIDTGVDPGHPALAGHRHLSIFSHGDDSGLWGHGTMVVGFIASQDQVYRGVAYGLDSILAGDMVRISESLSWAFMEDPNSEVDDPPDAINASIGSVTQSDYTLDARVFDEYIDRYDVLASIAAGNIYHS